MANRDQFLPYLVLSKFMEHVSFFDFTMNQFLARFLFDFCVMRGNFAF